jgi:hypothetical protein
MSKQIGILCVESGSEILPRFYLRGVPNLAVPPRIPSGRDSRRDNPTLRTVYISLTTSIFFVSLIRRLCSFMFLNLLRCQDPTFLQLFYQGTGLNPIRKELASTSHKSLFCTIDFLLFFSKSIFLVISIS